MTSAPPPQQPPDPLLLLGLAPNPTPDQIRRAYKKACLRHHPDKHPAGPARTSAERVFKQVSLAYNLLLDAATSPVTSSPCASSSSSPPSSASASPPPRAPVPADSPSMPDDGFSARAFVAPDHELDLPLTLEQFAAGTVKRQRLCIPGVHESRHPILTITVKPGYRPGDRIRFRAAWTAPGPCNAADVVFILSALPHPTFTLCGDDLRLVMRLALVDALAGALLAVPGLDGQPLNLLLDPVITPTTEQRLVGRGMPSRADPSKRGDLLVSFDISFPKRVEPALRPALRDLFSRSDSSAAPPPPSKRYIRRSSSLFVNLAPAHAAARRSSTALDAEMAASHGDADAMGGKPPRKPRRRFASIFR